MCRLLLVCLLLAPVLHAGPAFFARDLAAVNLFEPREPVPGVGSQPAPEAPPAGEAPAHDPYFDEAEPASDRWHQQFAVGIWGSPSARFASGPSAGVAGVGLEFAYMPLDWFGVMATAGWWAGYVEYRPPERHQYDERDWKYRNVSIFDFEIGARFVPVTWTSGLIYLDARFAYAVADAPEPVLRTQSWGLGGYFGVELGIHPAYIFIEGGHSYRAAIFKRNVGWLGTPEINDNGGWFWDLLRAGVRVYF